MLETFHIQSPFGLLKITISQLGLKSIVFLHNYTEEDEEFISERCAPYKEQLDEYFAGERKIFSLNLDLTEVPDFQREVLKMVYTIPYGKTRSYKQIATVLGNVKAARAVGTANAKNPIPVVIPCHRVLGNGGELTGYAYGLDLKMKLLEMENPQIYVPQIDLFETLV
ncbi:MAG: methylated-DNA--[protein]-cysteine S-methyltransferase [Saprospiraceae bacterium]|nr:methylated-DNA--[protein]-cysteine S-methyltransferase [Saprospiraceae bacterium]